MMKPEAAYTVNTGKWAYVCAALIAFVTLLLFSDAVHNSFVELDDVGYITDNRHIESLNLNTFIWSFTHFHEANWHPLTMLSLALDRRIWGMSAAGFHVTSIAIHSVTVLLIFFVYHRLLSSIARNMTASDGAWLKTAGSAMAALLFALHPLRVESVVWASERKDVLCLVFVVAALWWYLEYVTIRAEKRAPEHAQNRAYWLMMAMAACALMSKPTAVSLPFVLLILDWYPLKRISDRASFFSAIRNKAPLFLLVMVTMVLTVLAQQSAISQAPDVDVLSRLLVAAKALPAYLWKMFWPAALAPYYPHPGRVAEDRLYQYLPYLFLVGTAISALFICYRNKRPLLPAVSLFYLVTLAPMLGLLQVGGQWFADRYSYLPACGISLLWGGGAAWLSGVCWRNDNKFVAVLIVVVIACQIGGYSLVTRQQIKVWRNTETLASREIDLYPHHAGAAYVSRAKFRKENGQYEIALADVDKAMTIALRKNLKHKYAELSLARAELFSCLGRTNDALAALEWAIQTGNPGQLAKIAAIRHKIVTKHPYRCVE